MRFHFVRHGRRGLSNEVAVIKTSVLSINLRDAGQIRIEDFREIVQLFKGLFAGYPQIGRFCPTSPTRRSIQRPKMAILPAKTEFSQIKLPNLAQPRTIGFASTSTYRRGLN